MAQTRSRLHKKKFRAAGVHGKRHVDRPAHGVIANKRGLGHSKSPFIVYRKDTVMQKYGSRLPRYVPSKPHLYVVSCLAPLLTVLVVLLPEANAQTAVNITTYPYDNMRTGWNNQETSLTPANVATSQFKLLASTPLGARGI